MNMDDASIIRSADPAPARREAWRSWLASPPGRYALAWQQAQLDAAVADVFGFHALQCGLPELDALRDNRMPHRIRACERCDLPAHGGVQLLVEHFEELPIASQSLDLVVLPHVLEFATDPHQVLREIDRVLRPEGRVIVSGFNPISLWGGRQWLTRALTRHPFLPREGHFIGLPRLRDWFKLLSFEMDRGRYGCYRPPCRTEKWLERTRFMESAGDRWWPICGALYLVSATKRVRGMRLIGPAWRQTRPTAAPAVAVSRRTAPSAADTCNPATSAAGSRRPRHPTAA
jgi:SAM-dependent methyltransferase